MNNKKKLKRIKEIIGDDYDDVVVFAVKGNVDFEKRKVLTLCDSDSGTVAAMICNYLETDPVATAIVKEVVPHLDSDSLTSAMFNLSFGGNYHE